MTRMEKAALAQAAEWLRYSRSPQARRDRDLDRAARAKADLAAGHLPGCGLLKCAPACPSLKCH